MRITYIRLENVAGIKVGMNKDILEIDLSISNNSLIAIQAANGHGKTVFLSSLTPFSYVTSLDERSTLPYIIPGKDGYKEIRYQIDSDEYVIKHYYKATKESHSVKSYFMKNNEELNENGNVTSFNSLVEINFGLTQEMMRLIRIGSNVSSFISLLPARRKEYIGKLISEIDIYLQFHKKVTDDLKVLKTLTQLNIGNQRKLSISNIDDEESRLNELLVELDSLEHKRSDIEGRIRELDSLMSNNDITSLREKRNNTQRSIDEFNKLETTIVSEGLKNSDLSSMMNDRDKLNEELIIINSQIIGIRLNIDNLNRSIVRIEANLASFTNNGGLDQLSNKINQLHSIIDNTSEGIKSLVIPDNINSTKLRSFISKLEAFNQIVLNLYQLRFNAIRIYCTLYEKHISVDSWIREQSSHQTIYDEDTIKSLIEKLYGDSMCVEPQCDDDSCPYYKLASIFETIKNEFETDVTSPDDIRDVQIISNGIDQILNEFDLIKGINVPESLKEEWSEANIIKRFKRHDTLFDLNRLNDYLSLLLAYEEYQVNIKQLHLYEEQMLAYKNSGIETQLAEIKTNRLLISQYQSKLEELKNKLNDITSKKNELDRKINLLQRYIDNKRYVDSLLSNIQSLDNIIKPLEEANSQKQKLLYERMNVYSDIEKYKRKSKELEYKINEYKRLIDEANKLKKIMDELYLVQNAVSTKKGIPMFYIKRYLSKIHRLSNELLSMIYHGDFMLDHFKITSDTFEIPYIKNNRRIPDIKFGSQSEISLATMAFSFALVDSTSSKYNILLLDEVDAGLDDENRFSLLRMLDSWIDRLGCEQVFFISHNLSQLTNVPMDCIRLSEIDTTSQLQNVIYG